MVIDTIEYYTSKQAAARLQMSPVTLRKQMEPDIKKRVKRSVTHGFIVTKIERIRKAKWTQCIICGTYFVAHLWRPDTCSSACSKNLNNSKIHYDKRDYTRPDSIKPVTYRGRTCAYVGCNNNVKTGEWFCKEHKYLLDKVANQNDDYIYY